MTFLRSALIVILCLFFFGSTAQEDIELPDDYKHNVIKWNPTPFVLWSRKNINFSYERVLKPHRTFSVNLGYFELPSLGVLEDVLVENKVGKGGFTVSGDYRFYFKNRNTRMAPDGLYWGPFASIHHYGFSHDMTFIDNPSLQGTANLSASMSIASLGVQLGYQFVIKDRFTMDLIFIGPALSFYGIDVNLSGNVDINEEDEYLKALYDMLVNKIPGMEDLLDVGSIKKQGLTTSAGPGFRYMIQLGYRF